MVLLEGTRKGSIFGTKFGTKFGTSDLTIPFLCVRISSRVIEDALRGKQTIPLSEPVSSRRDWKPAFPH